MLSLLQLTQENIHAFIEVDVASRVCFHGESDVHLQCRTLEEVDA